MKSGSWIWLWAGLGFALLAAAWTAMFFFARQASVQSVPLVKTSEAHGGWNALSPTRSEGARPGRVERLEDKSLHPETEAP